MKFIRERGQHADAVFDLCIFAVIGAIRQGYSAFYVKFIGGVEDPLAAFRETLVAKARHLLDYPPAVYRVKRFERVQLFPIRSQSARHNRHAVHRRIIRVKIAQGSIQLRAVVDALAQNDLSAQLSPCVRQPSEVCQHLAGALVFHHFHAQLRIGGVD